MKIISKINAAEDINLTKIESRPSKQKLGDYLFFVDFEGAKDEPNVSQALKQIREKSAFLKILGSYWIDIVKLKNKEIYFVGEIISIRSKDEINPYYLLAVLKLEQYIY